MVITIIISITIIAALVAMIVVKRNEARMLASQIDTTKNECENRIADERQRSVEEVKRLQEDHKQQISMLRTELENATHKILEQQSEKLKNNNSEQIGTILNPLREQLRNMKETIDQNKDSHARDASALREAVKILAERSERQNLATQNLTEALKNKGKVQGDWGEQVLETILQMEFLETR